MTIDTTKIRYTTVGGKKAFFLSDITKSYGRGIASKLGKRAVFRKRVVHEGNSQTRNLVYTEELANLDMLQTEKVANNDAPLALNLHDVKKDIFKKNVVEKVKQRSIKEHIKTLCKDWSIAEIKAKGLNASALEDSGRWEYREPYRIMYACFDKYMEEKLNEVGASLASLGLGLEASKKKKSGKTYMSSIAEAGQLENLHVIAQALFEPTAV